MSDPFRVPGPAVISFSGGRTSGYMLWRILQAHGGTLPDDVIVLFANTGKEHEATLRFVRDCAENWGVPITWIEYRSDATPNQRFSVIDPAEASVAGEPFSSLIDDKNYLPNPVTRFCTQELKIRPMKFYCQQAMGWKNWTNIVGLRADEPSRVAKIGQNRDVFDVAVPLARAGITRRDVADFWSRQNFDLELPNVDGNTAMGNCDLCFLKPASTIMGILRTEPWRGEWWAEQEARARASKPDGALFRKDRPSYAKMMQAVADQQDFGFGDLDERQECFCHD